MENPTNEPILSICIPTYNRAELLKETLESIVISEVFQQTNKVEIVISNNASTDDTHEIASSFLERFPEKIRYNFLENPVSGDENFIHVLNQGTGRFLKLHNDKILFKKGSLEEIISVLETSEIGNILFLTGKRKRKNANLSHFQSFEELLLFLNYWATWIGGLCIRRTAYEKITDPGRYTKLHFAQMDLMSEALKEDGFCSVYEKVFFVNVSWSRNSRSYSLAQVFGTDLNTLLGYFVQDGRISDSTRFFVMRKMLPRTNRAFSSEEIWNRALLEDYWQNMYPIYGKWIPFYFYFIKMLAVHPLDSLKRGSFYQAYRKFRTACKKTIAMRNPCKESTK